ncbi:MAG: hypothetical protein VR64_22850 [Desulfatitalea sp. BRH_c12]|nr:MAG: hypothetical protein VR64_22850 [Desulfatitalea sp. BRH_c12]
MKSLLRRIFIGAFFFLLVVTAIQAAIFYTLANRTFAPVPSELAILFKGDDGRTDFFYGLIEMGDFGQAFIPGASEKNLAFWDKKFNASRNVKHLPVTPPTSSTFEDALASADAIRAHGFHSVVLVTSDYHMPRSWFLLRFLTIGREVAIQPVEVPSRMQLAGVSVRAKMIYNEMVNFWGSLAEWAYHKISGRLLSENPKAVAVTRTLKKVLLFDFTHPSPRPSP